MRLLRKARRFMTCSPAMKWMLIEAFFYLAWGRIFKLLPFAKAASSLGEHMKETPFTPASQQEMLLMRQVSKAVHTMSRVTWWESQCLVKAVAAMKMLERRGIPSTLYLGSGRDDTGHMAAHAWLRSGSYILTGKEGHEKYAVVGIFGNSIST
ncbi:lasso peptide biosynthesis B2 protein [Paenibacillus lemnae]|uniref:Lasso peptide biosynthesis B2 protein n=1 Tax=Paenibacillus lemnae TaxID=1330551 RepID=A0A848M6A1_PAELE|nr:lasso peptide biosynthesis B2 protein [Paenibacillus lemnae]NMO95720.1 lasso peptide biosynthesis B2 protein [Paenibacillus lemnae]